MNIIQAQFCDYVVEFIKQNRLATYKELKDNIKTFKFRTKLNYMLKYRLIYYDKKNKAYGLTSNTRKKYDSYREYRDGKCDDIEQFYANIISSGIHNFGAIENMVMNIISGMICNKDSREFALNSFILHRISFASKCEIMFDMIDKYHSSIISTAQKEILQKNLTALKNYRNMLAHCSMNYTDDEIMRFNKNRSLRLISPYMITNETNLTVSKQKQKTMKQKFNDTLNYLSHVKIKASLIH